MTASAPKVILRHCDDYDPERIRTIVREGLDELQLRPHGRVLVKPNLVMVMRGLMENAHTRVEFAEGVVKALQDRAGDDVEEIALGERGGITMPTRLMGREAGYTALARRLRIPFYMFDEELQVPVQLKHPDRLRDHVFTADPVARCDFFVNIPKFKAHPWTTVTFGAKNYIGIQDDRHRLIDHDHRLDEKVADLQEIIQPKFLAVDAIVAGEGRMLTPSPFPLKLIIMGNNQTALDTVCCHILGIDPRSVDHIRLCGERGYGPLDLEQIELSGDVTLEVAQKRAEGFEVGLVRVEDYFADSPIRAVAGPPPEPERTDYCWGGCPGALEEAIEIVRTFQPDAYTKMRPLTMVFGAYDGPLELREPREKVVFVGDCACWKGNIKGQPIDLPSIYVDRKHKDPRHATVTDIFVKMAAFYWGMLRSGSAPYVRIRGCPVSVAENVLVLSAYGGSVNPYFDPRTVIPFARAWTAWRVNQLARAVTGKPYQTALPPDHTRGELPPPGASSAD
jgi:uncharacterized protein (DUF362 family)